MQGIRHQESMEGTDALSSQFAGYANYLRYDRETPIHSNETELGDESPWSTISGLKKGWGHREDRDSELRYDRERPIHSDEAQFRDELSGGSSNGLKKGWRNREDGDAEPDPDPPLVDPSDDGSQDPDAIEPGGFEPLTRSTQAITTTHDGQVIENLDLYIGSGDAITVLHDNVIIRNVRIFHADGHGINVVGASNVTIEFSEIIHSAPPSGIDPFADAQQSNIRAYGSPGITINEVIVRDGSSGIYLGESPGAQISNVEGYNFHGPMPRGQFVQFDKSGGSSLTNFYALNDAAESHPEDIVSVYNSPNVVISNGVIDGNNSRTGVAVMFEGQSQGGRVFNVDAISQGNGAFSSYSDDVEFVDTRSFDNIYADQGRGDSASNALIWNISADGISILDSTYTDPGNPNNIAWNLSRAVTAEITEDPDAVPMDGISVDLSWT